MSRDGKMGIQDASPWCFPLCKRGIEGDFLHQSRSTSLRSRLGKSPLPPFFKGGKQTYRHFSKGGSGESRSVHRCQRLYAAA